tara:strand:- start:76 stop:597 length:522 start_codon:yes stop_codon:yes gene_type:complete
MTVIVQKPEFNLREKLSELEFARLPHEKMPSGSVVQIVQFTSDEQSITGGAATAKINSTFSPRIFGSKFNVSVFIPNCTSGDGERLIGQVYLGTNATPSENTRIIQFRQRMFGTSADDTVCIFAQDFGGFTCLSTEPHYASLVLTPTQNTVVARHSSNANDGLIKLIVQEIAQ